MAKLFDSWICGMLGLHIKAKDDLYTNELLESGYLFAEILRKYDLISDDQILIMKQEAEHSQHNLSMIAEWLTESNLPLDITPLQDINKGVPGAAYTFLYSLFFTLHENLMSHNELGDGHACSAEPEELDSDAVGHGIRSEDLREKDRPNCKKVCTDEFSEDLNQAIDGESLNISEKSEHEEIDEEFGNFEEKLILKQKVDEKDIFGETNIAEEDFSGTKPESISFENIQKMEANEAIKPIEIPSVAKEVELMQEDQEIHPEETLNNYLSSQSIKYNGKDGGDLSENPYNAYLNCDESQSYLQNDCSECNETIHDEPLQDFTKNLDVIRVFPEEMNESLTEFEINETKDSFMTQEIETDDLNFSASQNITLFSASRSKKASSKHSTIQLNSAQAFVEIEPTDYITSYGTRKKSRKTPSDNSYLTSSGGHRHSKVRIGRAMSRSSENSLNSASSLRDFFKEDLDNTSWRRTHAKETPDPCTKPSRWYDLSRMYFSIMAEGIVHKNMGKLRSSVPYASKEGAVQEQSCKPIQQKTGTDPMKKAGSYEKSAPWRHKSKKILAMVLEKEKKETKKREAQYYRQMENFDRCVSHCGKMTGTTDPCGIEISLMKEKIRKMKFRRRILEVQKWERHKYRNFKTCSIISNLMGRYEEVLTTEAINKAISIGPEEEQLRLFLYHVSLHKLHFIKHKSYEQSQVIEKRLDLIERHDTYKNDLEYTRNYLKEMSEEYSEKVLEALENEHELIIKDWVQDIICNILDQTIQDVINIVNENKRIKAEQKKSKAQEEEDILLKTFYVYDEGESDFDAPKLEYP